MFLKSDAIIIGRRPFRNTSLLLQCYTRRAGFFWVTAKGAFRRRRKDEPPSVPDLFERGEMVLHLHPLRESAILCEWTLEDVRSGLRRDYDAFRAASGCAALVAALSRDGGRSGELFGPLERALGELDGGCAARQALWAFALRVLARAGFLAPLDACASCGGAFAAGRAEAVGLSPEAGGLVCAECRRAQPVDRPGAEQEGRGGGRAEAGPSFLPLPPEAAAAARFLGTSPAGAASRLKVSRRASVSLERAVRCLAEYTLERPMPVLSPG